MAVFTLTPQPAQSRTPVGGEECIGRVRSRRLAQLAVGGLVVDRGADAVRRPARPERGLERVQRVAVAQAAAQIERGEPGLSGPPRRLVDDEIRGGVTAALVG